MSIYRSPRGRRIVRDLYDRAVERLGVPVERRRLPTSFGETHLLVGGPAEAPPLVVAQGGNSLNPLTLAWYRPLLERFRVFAPDTVGHPGYSAPVRPARRDGGYGRWLAEVIEGLGLERPAVLGSSHGGAVALQAARRAPERVGPTVLVIPMGVLPPSVPTLLSLSPAALLHRWAPDEERLRRAAETLFTEPLDELWLAMVEAVAEHVRFEKLLPLPLRPGTLDGWRAPCLLFASERDALFPAGRLLERARRLVPRLEEAVVLEGQGHVPDAAAFARVNLRIAAFLERERRP